LSRWVQLAFQRNKYTILNDLTQSTYFLDNNTADMFIKNEHTGKTITSYQKEAPPYVEVEVTNVVLGDLTQAPYSAQIEFLKHIKDPLNGTDISTERWTATVNYTFRDSVPNNIIAVNPLGFVIIHYHVDQAFSALTPTQTQAQPTQPQPDTAAKPSAGSTANTR
jgi:type IV secretory pathway component VirB8